MSFKLPVYPAPDFSQPKFQDAPNVQTAPVLQAGVAPENYHSTSMFPEYFKVNGQWLLAKESRMDSSVVLQDGQLLVVENRNLQPGDQVVHANGFYEEGRDHDDQFVFRQGRSRETSYARDYDELMELLRYEKVHGKVVWVMGPAFAFDSDARAAMQAMVEHGYVDGLMAGNALATHDLEAGYLGTALGQDVYTQQAHFNGHYNHIDTINEVRRLGSIQAFVESGQVRNGIMYECVRHQVPFVLVGSVRDDGPLPEVYGDVYQGQDAMRELVRKATTIICMASFRSLERVSTSENSKASCHSIRSGTGPPFKWF